MKRLLSLSSNSGGCVLVIHALRQPDALDVPNVKCYRLQAIDVLVRSPGHGCPYALLSVYVGCRERQ